MQPDQTGLPAHKGLRMPWADHPGWFSTGTGIWLIVVGIVTIVRPEWLWRKVYVLDVRIQQAYLRWLHLSRFPWGNFGDGSEEAWRFHGRKIYQCFGIACILGGLISLAMGISILSGRLRIIIPR